ncbi:MAG: DNA adenine methylase [Candidatus Pacebacteria bacterium]|jgi:DNA adenine methylase|nr:DNA adenine methylase [Candidatus Paceibacterota bacterium]
MNKTQAINKLIKVFDINEIFAQRVFSLVDDKEDLISEASQLILEKPKPFVKWVGGKRQLLNQFKLLNLYPPKGFNPLKARYYEPFVGGGAVFFDLLPKNAFLSDLNRELMTTYNEIKNNVEDLIHSLRMHKIEKEYFLKIRAFDVNMLSDLEIASRFIYLNRTCFNGLYRVNKKGQFNVPFGKYKNPLICDQDNLRKVSKALQGIELKVGSYSEILTSAKKGDFVYLDPPYYPLSKTSSFTAYTNQCFLEKEQVKLRDTFLELSEKGCFVMLSNSDTPFTRKIYSEAKITKVYAGRMINSNALKRGKISELVITNY